MKIHTGETGKIPVIEQPKQSLKEKGKLEKKGRVLQMSNWMLDDKHQ